MKATLVLLALCVARMAQADGRRIIPEEQTVGDAAAVCSDLKDLGDELHDDAGLGKLHEKCTWPLIYLGYKHQTEEEAKAYCKSEACVEFVKELKGFAPCTWTHVSDASENILQSAKRVLQDCG